jgi:hypothetical protein
LRTVASSKHDARKIFKDNGYDVMKKDIVNYTESMFKKSESSEELKQCQRYYERLRDEK